ncbi:MAG: diguanylate cyclase/phosphodiesterase with sensor(s) [Acidimicrobiales bacterium]|nr:diguanylate cyclase/phosphodiesterase with sensor(s) [Acidimicrobiales bacterium]
MHEGSPAADDDAGGTPLQASTPATADRFELLATVMTSGILATDEHGQVSYANPAAIELFWSDLDRLLGDGWLSVLRPDDREEMAAGAEQAMATGTHATATGRIDVFGHDRWVRARFHALAAGGHTTGWVATFDDITAEREASAELRRRATHDPLTGMPNRALLHDRLAFALARMRRNGGSVGVLYLDLDGFKPVNDQFGHAAGDRVLVEVARRISSTVRSTDTAARIGGDEFVLVTEGGVRQEIHRLAERISEAVSMPMVIDDRTHQFSISIGGATTEDAAVDSRMLLAQADQAMYQAKRTGTGIELFDPHPTR